MQLPRNLTIAIMSAIVLLPGPWGGGGAALAAEKPALVIVISVDQLRADYLDRFRPWFGADGFNRFLKTGASFPRAAFRHAATFTGPAHASIGTGLDPAHHGVVGNSWYDAALRAPVYCVEDPGEWVVGTLGAGKTPKDPAASPSRLMTVSRRTPAPRRDISAQGEQAEPSSALQGKAALGDRLKERFPASRVVGVALKDRAAVLMAGKDADAVYWFMDDLERFVTSSYYPAASVPLVLSFDERIPVYFAKPDCTKWEPLQEKGVPRIPEADLVRLTLDTPELWPFKGPRDGVDVAFPHPLATGRAKVSSPCGDRLILDLARYTIRQMDLGRNPAGAPDLLFIGMSSTDYSGHMFGPDSREIADAVVRLDATLASFFAWLDGACGRDRVLVWLTADHGVAPIPEVALARASGAVPRPGDAGESTRGPGAYSATGAASLGGGGREGAASDSVERSDAASRSGGAGEATRGPGAHATPEVGGERGVGQDRTGPDTGTPADAASVATAAAAREARAGRVDFYLKGNETTATVRDGPPERVRIERALAMSHGYQLREELPNKQEGLIVWFEEPCLYVNRDVVRMRLARRQEAAGGKPETAVPDETVAAEVGAVSGELRDLVRKIPGVANVWTHEELSKAAHALQERAKGSGPRRTDPTASDGHASVDSAGAPAGGSLLDAFAHSFDATRTGDVCAALKPGWIWSSDRKGTTHGQPYDYDQRVPLLAWGAGVRAGSYDLPTSPLAIARTTAEILDLEGVGEDDVPPLEPVAAGYAGRPKRHSGGRASDQHRPAVKRAPRD